MLHLIVLDTNTSHCFLSFNIMFSITTSEKDPKQPRDRSRVNKVNGCLVSHHNLYLNWLVSYNGSRQMVAGLRRVLYWVQLLNMSFHLCV